VQAVQVDEIWSFVYAKAKNVPTAKAAPAEGWRYLDVDRYLCRHQADPELLRRRVVMPSPATPSCVTLPIV